MIGDALGGPSQAALAVRLNNSNFDWRHADASVSMPCLRYLYLIFVPKEATLGFARG